MSDDLDEFGLAITSLDSTPTPKNYFPAGIANSLTALEDLEAALKMFSTLGTCTFCNRDHKPHCQDCTDCLEEASGKRIVRGTETGRTCSCGKTFWIRHGHMCRNK